MKYYPEDSVTELRKMIKTDVEIYQESGMYSLLINNVSAFNAVKGKKAFCEIVDAMTSFEKTMNNQKRGRASYPYISNGGLVSNYIGLTNTPDEEMTAADIIGYGYDFLGKGFMYPLRMISAMKLFGEVEIFKVYEDGTEAVAESLGDITEHGGKNGLFCIEKQQWHAYLKTRDTEKPEVVVTVTCAGITETYSSFEEPMDIYAQGAEECDGCEQSRYANILGQLMEGLTEVSDED